ncbi:MAG: ion transporter [Lachnospiraceae bacterium]|nr:ion transporter [Lachnospiraceae bacterium]
MLKFRKAVFHAVDVGYTEDIQGRAYDILNLSVILINLVVTVMMTFKEMMDAYGGILQTIEAVTVFFFAVDYLLRLFTSSFLFPAKKPVAALGHYVISFNGIIDLLSFIPYYLPIFFPSGAVAFRMFRVMRIFRLFRINAYYDSLNVITEVLKSKAKQLISSVFILLLLMLAASLCMYSVENPAQPEVFDNALSGIWWASATLMTVGYGDIYPITATGKILGTIITFLGVGVAAIPTGIISAGFVEQYSRLQQVGNNNSGIAMQFIRVALDPGDKWIGKSIRELYLPDEVIITAVTRNGEVIVPRGDLELEEGDILVFGAEPFRDGINIALKEIEITADHNWKDKMIRDLDIARQTFIVSVKRNGNTMIPNGSLRFAKGDRIILYSKE